MRAGRRRCNVLVITGGGKEHLRPFLEVGQKFGVNVYIASFSDLSYFISGRAGKFVLSCLGKDVSWFDVVYIRLVGRRHEDVALLVRYAKQRGVRLVDGVYQKSRFSFFPLPKSLEMKELGDAGIPVPPTLFGSLDLISKLAPKKFGFPFVIKGTRGKQGHDVWSPRNGEELVDLLPRLRKRGKEKNERFFAQPFIRASRRFRVLVIGGRAVAGLVRPTRWRRRFVKKVDGEYPVGVSAGVLPVPFEQARLAIRAARVVGAEIAGVDIVYDDKSKRPYVLEVNLAPRWVAVKRDTGVNVEEEIVKYLVSLWQD